MARNWINKLDYVDIEFCLPHEWKWALEHLAPGDYLAWYDDFEDEVGGTVYLAVDNGQYLLLKEDHSTVLAWFDNLQVITDSFNPPYRFIRITYNTKNDDRLRVNKKRLE